LGAVGVKTDLAGKAFIIQVLMETMADKNLPPQVRTEAARALGRAEIAPNVDVPLIVFEIAKLTQEMSEKYNEEQKAGGQKVSTHWPTSFFNIFLAFHAIHKEERKLYGARKPGLLSRYEGKPFVDGPYQKIRPVVSFMLTQPDWLNPDEKDVLKRRYRYNAIAGNLITDLASWQSKNPPSATTVQPGMPAFRTSGKAVSSKRSKTSPVSSRE
jgi:hypothetical protein